MRNYALGPTVLAAEQSATGGRSPPVSARLFSVYLTSPIAGAETAVTCLSLT